MIIAVSGLFQIPGIHRIENRMLMSICYDAESHDDAKRDFLTRDECLKGFADGYTLIGLNTLEVSMVEVVGVCAEAANASITAIFDVVKQAKAKAEGGEE